MREVRVAWWWLKATCPAIKGEASNPWLPGRVSTYEWMSLTGIADAWRETGGLKHVNVRATETEEDIQIAVFILTTLEIPNVRVFLSVRFHRRRRHSYRTYRSLSPLSRTRTARNILPTSANVVTSNRPIKPGKKFQVNLIEISFIYLFIPEVGVPSC